MFPVDGSAMVRKRLRFASESVLGPLLITGPVSHRLANLAISLAYVRNTMRYVRSAGRAPNYIDPVRFSEKMQCRKLFDRNPLITVLCDKLEARAHAEKAAADLKLPKIYWCGDDPASIPFDDLPLPYVIKSNHGSGSLVAVRDRSEENRAEIRSRCRRWLKRPYGRGRGEWGYRDIRRRVYAEELLPAPEGQLYPDDYKFVTIAGRVEWIEHVHDRNQTHSKTYFDREWKRIKFRRWQGIEDPLRMPLEDAPRPPRFNRMIEIAERLGGGIDELRVDLYAIGGEVYFGEFTVYEESGMGVAYPEDEVFDDFPSRGLDRVLGDMWQLAPVPVSAKLACVFLGRNPRPVP
jgi:hypothetical protein